MSTTGDILRKKLRPRMAAPGPAGAWWSGHMDRVLRDVCKSVLGMDVAVTEFTHRQMPAADALADMPAIVLPFLLSTAQGKRGLFTMDGALSDGLIEQQMLGAVLPIARLDRPFTAIDAGLSEGFVRAVLGGISAAPGTLAGLSTLGPEQDRAALRLALGDGQYVMFSAQLDMGPGIKTGRFDLWVPVEQAASPQVRARGPNPAMTKLLADCPVPLEARMTGGEVDAATLMSLKVGGVLNLPVTILGNVALRDCDGTLVAHGKLGQLKGARAVKLHSIAATSAQSGSAQPVAAPTTRPSEDTPNTGSCDTSMSVTPAEATPDIQESAPQPQPPDLIPEGAA